MVREVSQLYWQGGIRDSQYFISSAIASTRNCRFCSSRPPSHSTAACIPPSVTAIPGGASSLAIVRNGFARRNDGERCRSSFAFAACSADIGGSIGIMIRLLSHCKRRVSKAESSARVSATHLRRPSHPRRGIWRSQHRRLCRLEQLITVSRQLGCGGGP